MRFVYTQELLDYMKDKNRDTIIVEVVSSDSSDFEVTELHTFLADSKRAEFFVQKKKYIPRETEHGRVLLPPYKLEYEEEIRLGLKKVLFVRMVTQDGISL